MFAIIEFIGKSIKFLLIIGIVVGFVLGILFVKKFLMSKDQVKTIQEQYKKDTLGRGSQSFFDALNNPKPKIHKKHHPKRVPKVDSIEQQP